MGNAALKIEHPFSGASGVSPSHEKLVRELHARLIEIAREVPAVGKSAETDTLKAAADIGYSLIGFSNPHPPTLNIAVDEFGHILLTVYGPGQREADIWVKNGSGRFAYVANEGDSFEEGELSGAEARRITEWLAGRTKSVR